MRKQPRNRSAAIRAGVMRHVVGAGRAVTRREAKAALPAVPAKPGDIAVKKPMVVTDRVLEAARRMSHRLDRRRNPAVNAEDVLKPYTPPPGVLPPGKSVLAMDEVLGGAGFSQLMEWGGLGGGVGASFQEGIGFLGYSYLAQLTQRPEYRRISERIATEMTRKWIKFNVVSKIDEDVEPIEKQDSELAGDRAPGAPPAGAGSDPLDDEGEGPEVAATTAATAAEAEKTRVRESVAKKESAVKAKRVKELTDEMSRLKVKDAFYNIAEGDGWFGRYHLYLELKGIDPSTSSGQAELKTPIGNGRDSASRAKVGPGRTKRKLTGVLPVEPMWCYPATYDAMYPTKRSFYTPASWYVNGVEYHGSRLLTFVGREMPDILKPAYAFGGLSMSQMAKPYVDNWLRTRQAVADLIESFSVSGVYTNMQATLQDGGDQAIKRIELFNITRSNAGAFMLDKESEEYFNVSTPLGTLDALQAQSQEQMSSVSGIPLIILLGITPTGLNASSEGEIRAFYDWINAFQESLFRDPLQAVIHFVMLSLWGEIDEEITFEFEPLWSMTDKEQAEIQKIEAETDQIRIDSGVLDPGEVRKALAAQPESRYADINPEDVPEPPQDPMGEGDDPFGGGDGEGDAGGDTGRSAADSPVGAKPGAQDEWNEGDHPRADDGKFGSAGGGKSQPQSKSGKGASTSSSSNAALNVSKLKKQGGKLGSNEGGVYTDDAGAKFYVKKPSTKAHVANEMAASRLYQLAGVNTLKYRDAGPDHVATEWQELDKNNISKMSAAERKEATKDFGVHAWLSNWDAAGTGGDNQGIMGGKPTTLDVGGSLRYRAQGGPKGSAFGHKVTELDTMRDESKSYDAGRLFGKMTDAELRSSVERVTSIPDDKIREAVGDDKELADILIARKQDMAKRFDVKGAADEGLMLAALDSAIEDDQEELSADAAMMAAALESNSGVPIAGEEDDDEDDDVEEVAPGFFTMAHDEEQFDESKHKRDSDGKFSSTGGGGGKKNDESDELENLILPGHPDHPDTPALNAAKSGAFKTKKEHIAHLLTNGTTPKELMETMGWPSVSMPAQAQALGMKLSVETINGKKVYKGTPMTDAEKAAAKEAAKQKAQAKKGTTPETMPGSPAGQKKDEGAIAKAALKKLDPKIAATIEKPEDDDPFGAYPSFIGKIAEAIQQKDAGAIQKLFAAHPNFAEKYKASASEKGKAAIEAVMAKPVHASVPQATEAELKKAAKSTTLPINTSAPAGVLLIQEFNDKYAGKDGLSKEQLNQKVQDYKDLQAMLPKVQAEYDAQSKAEKAAAEKKALEEIQKKQAEKLAKEKAEMQAKFDADPELQVHYEAMEKLFGGKGAGAQFVEQAANKVKKAGLSKHITAEAAVPIIAYSGSHYQAVNNQLRSGKMTPAQYAFSKSLNAGLDKLPSHTETTYRKASLSPDQAALYEPGMIVEERGFMSTSKNQGTWSGSHQFTIHGKNGKDIQKLSSHPGEAEVLFKSGSRFEVVSKDGTHIVLKEV